MQNYKNYMICNKIPEDHRHGDLQLPWATLENVLNLTSKWVCNLRITKIELHGEFLKIGQTIP